MRGSDGRSGALFSYLDLEARVPSGHPLRAIQSIVNQALGELAPTFAALDRARTAAARGCCRPSIRSAWRAS